MSAPSIILSAFADEAANSKTAVEQLSAMSAIGLQYYSPRFVDVTGSGKVKHVGWSLQLDAPEFSSLGGGEAVSAGRIVPIYRLTKGLTALTLRRAMRALIDRVGADLEEPLPEELRDRLSLVPIARAIEEAHWPQEFAARDAALRRLAFDELLAVQIALVRRRRRRRRGVAPRIEVDPAKRQAAAEDINRTFAKHCYQIPIAWGPTGIPHSPNLKGLDTMMAPDGVAVLQGIGNFNLLSAWKAN